MKLEIKGRPRGRGREKNALHCNYLFYCCVTLKVGWPFPFGQFPLHLQQTVSRASQNKLMHQQVCFALHFLSAASTKVITETSNHSLNLLHKYIIWHYLDLNNKICVVSLAFVSLKYNFLIGKVFGV